MARVDGDTVSGGGSGAESGSGSPESVDIGSHIDEAVAASRNSGPGTGKRVRRTREQLAADGYYEGKDIKQSVRTAATAKKGSLDVNSIQFALTGIHALLAVGMSAPELELSPEESETVAKNIVAVGRHYDLQQTAKATDWGNLIVSLGVVYGGRFMRIGIRKSAEKKARGRDVKVGTGFAVTPPNSAPQQPEVMRPNVAPTAATMPGTRPRTTEDLKMLDEVEAFLVP
jgi:hypothetical protein